MAKPVLKCINGDGNKGSWYVTRDGRNTNLDNTYKIILEIENYFAKLLISITTKFVLIPPSI